MPATAKTTKDLRIPIKTDGTKDKRYKMPQFVKTDGTRDMRTVPTRKRN